MSLLVRRVARECARRHVQLSSRCSVAVASHVNMMFFSSKPPTDDETVEDAFAEWIPPDRPLVGDKGSYEQDDYEEDDDDDDAQEYPDEEMDDEEQEEWRLLELELQAEEERQKQHEALSSSSTEEPVDWLQTRRSKQQLDGVDMMTPDLGTAKKWEDSDVDVIRHTLLTLDEITACLTAMGGKDVTVISNTHDRRMGAASGMVLVTGSSPAQIFLLADTLVRQLKRRDLADVGVVGAQLGAEGSNDKFDTWRVVDCLNYAVHVLDASTRKHLDLESLWSGKDASLRVSMYNEKAMDDYVAANPVPEGYGNLNVKDWGSSISQMERNRWIVPHRPVVDAPGKKRGRRKRARRR